LRAKRPAKAAAGATQDRARAKHGRRKEVTAALANFSVARDAAGALCMEEVTLDSIAARFGTPTFVYSRAALTAAYRKLDGALKSARNGKPHLICYAVKANSNLAVLNVLAKLGAGFDIVSGGELRRVLAAGGSASQVVFSGLGKTAAEIELALEANIKCFNVESESELLRINGIAAKLKKRAAISLRVNPDVDAKTHPYISTGLKNNKFGIGFDRALDVYRRASKLSHIDVAGVDCHIGSQLTDASPLVEAMGRIVALADQLRTEGVAVHHICPGGGVGISYSGEETIDLAAYARNLEAALNAGGVARDCELLLEPGRLLVGNTGVLLTKVEYVKPTAAKNFLVVDAAMNDLIRPPLYQAHHEIVVASAPHSDTATRTYDVVGPICESADVLGHDRALAAREGDLIAILSAGAYGFVMASNYNTRPRAAEVMIDGSTAHLIRERETVDALFAGEHLIA
jgi:diaminopimelate decarboxylase